MLGISDALFERTSKPAAINGWAVHTHLSEVREELTEARLRYGATTIEHAGRTGLLESDDDRGPLHLVHRARHRPAQPSTTSTVAHNPVANMLLGNGVCPVPRLRREGITIGLGTDGAASNDNQDMFGVIKTAGLLHKVNTMDPTIIDARDGPRDGDDRGRSRARPRRVKSARSSPASEPT